MEAVMLSEVVIDVHSNCPLAKVKGILTVRTLLSTL
jgi:hypothetical protein